jgi:hypothetical protein
MPITYRVASEAERIADKLIGKDFPIIGESGLRIVHLFRSEASKSGGKLCLGKTRKVGGIGALLAMDGGIPEDPVIPSDVALAVIEYAEDIWQRMTSIQREALVFHELCHIVVEPGEEEDDVWSFRLRTHDLEAFADEVTRYGAWKSDIAYFAEATAEALRLPFDGTPAPA